MSTTLQMKENIELVPENANISVKKKKGRPRKNPIENENTPAVPQEKKKRGRKKKEKVEEEVKQKKKRGRKAALKFFSSTIRKKIPLTTVIYDNDKSILHLDIKEDEDAMKKTITYDVLKSEYNKDDTIFGTKISHLETGKRTFDDSDNENDDENDEHEESDESGSDDSSGSGSDSDDNQKIFSKDDDNDILCDYIESSENMDIKELYEKRLESRLKQDNQLIKNLENLHNDDNLLSKLLNNVNKQVKDNKQVIAKKESYDDIKKKGVFMILDKYIEASEWIDKTDVCCWWCCHKFDSIPIGMPFEYNSKINKFRVKGVYCSFACMLASDTKMCVKSKSMITHLYKQLTGGYSIDLKDDYIKMLYNDKNVQELFKDNQEYKDEYIQSLASFIDEPLEKAPPRCTLKMFGGHLTIEEFRNSTKERKVYRMVEYPMYVSRDYVEEVDLQNLKKVNKNLFGKQQYTPQTNALDDKKLEEVKTRVQSSVVVTNNSIDRFITF
jgi:hypothetical protein